MATQMNRVMAANASLSEPMQQRLQARVAQHNGNVDAVIEEIRSELAQMDADAATQTDSNRQRYQSQRALMVAQTDYLKQLGSEQKEEPKRSQGFWSRFRRVQRTTATE